MVLDRGFPDVVNDLTVRGVYVQMPAFNDKKTANLNTEKANNSRFVTKCRYVVENRNGHFKKIFKIFGQVYDTRHLKHLMIDFKVAAALINRYFPLIISDKENGTDKVARMFEKLHVPNELQKIVEKNNFQRNVKKFIAFDQANFPKLTWNHLILLAVGTYQLKLAPRYFSAHKELNNNEFIVFTAPEALCKEYCSAFYVGEKKPQLLLVKMNPRFSAHRPPYYTYVLFDREGSGINAILAHFCDCKAGARTVGSCAHVICVVWFLSFGRHTVIKEPASHVKRFFDHQNEFHDDDDSDFDEY